MATDREGFTPLDSALLNGQIAIVDWMVYEILEQEKEKDYNGNYRNSHVLRSPSRVSTVRN